MPFGYAEASEGLRSFNAVTGNANWECLKRKFWLETAKLSRSLTLYPTPATTRSKSMGFLATLAFGEKKLYVAKRVKGLLGI